MYTRDVVDLDIHSSGDSHRDIFGVIRKYEMDCEGKEMRNW